MNERGMRILHLSDVHFGLDRDGTSKHAFTVAGKTAPEALVDVLCQPALSTEEPVALIVISGDVGWSGASADYADALTACRALNKRLNAPLLVVAGNHDVDRAAGRSDSARQDAFVQFLKDLHGTEIDKAYPFINRPNTGLAKREALIAWHADTERRVLVVGINSGSRINAFEHCQNCRRRTPAEPKSECDACHLPLPRPTRRVAIEPSVATSIESEIALLPQRERWLKMLVLHHNLMPFEEPAEDGHVDLRNVGTRDSDMIANSAALQAWLGRTGFHLVLHGHKHQPNARVDTLFRRDDPSGRRIVVLGAGTAGVIAGDRAPEPLGFFDLHVERLSNTRFLVEAQPFKIATGSLTPYAAEDFAALPFEVGPDFPSPPVIFYAETFADCHAAIARATTGRGIVRNFTSVVDFRPPVSFQPPPTAKRAQKDIDKADVASSFAALHPEADPHNEESPWDDPVRIQERLAKLRARFQFSHGPRMFAALDGGQSAIERAVGALITDPNTSHGYVSIFASNTDLLGSSEPPPGLAGIQFSADPSAERLDVTFIFRKLDLAFWWSVNMYEALHLWKWALDRVQRSRRYSAGRITFTAVLAEWKTVDTAAFTTRLDDLDVNRMFYLATLADVGHPEPLIERLREKRDRTNQNNIDLYGMKHLMTVVSSIVSSPERIGGAWTSLESSLQEAHDEMANAQSAAARGDTQSAVRHLANSLGRIEDIENELAGSARTRS